MYFLEHAELYIVQEPLTKNRTHQTTRWKQVVMCESEEPLLEYKRLNESPNYKLRVIEYKHLKEATQ